VWAGQDESDAPRGALYIVNSRLSSGADGAARVNPSEIISTQLNAMFGGYTVNSLPSDVPKLPATAEILLEMRADDSASSRIAGE
jgi:hypothetical protein